MRLASSKRLFAARSGSRVVTMVALAGVVGAVAMADVSSAAIPTGVNCQTDGKINGRGATFQTSAQALFAAGFRDDVCGPVVTADTDAPDTMVAYNYAATGTSFTGSGQGRLASSCRTDAFAGSDTPYDEATLALLNGAPGAVGTCPTAAFTPPFAPNSAPYPNAGDHASALMSFPVAGSAVTIIAHLPNSVCGGADNNEFVSALQLTRQNVSDLMGGNITSWNDPRLTANNPTLTACNTPVTRVVRVDSSGTTQIFKNFLKNVDGPRTGATCDASTTWTTLALNSGNIHWPGETSPPPAGCSVLARGTGNGNLPLITKVGGTAGAVGYADLADAVANQGTYSISNVQNATATSFEPPANSRAANCNLGAAASLPGSTNKDAVGLNAGNNNWALDNSGVNHGDATNFGSQYPICGLTWGLVYTNLASAAASSTQPNARLSQDQRRTLYSYETYILSSTAQDRLGSAFYTSLPPSWLVKLRAGFQASF